MLVMAVSYLDRQVFAVLAPTITRELGVSDVQYGWLNSAFALAYLVGALIAGRWIDRVGCRRGLVRAVLAWTLVAASHVASAGFASLCLLRTALGLAESPSFLGAAQAVRAGVSPVRRPAAIGFLYTGSSFGAALAPVLGIALSEHFGWRTAFIATASFGLLWIPFWLFATKRVPSLLNHAQSRASTPVKLTNHAAVIRAGLLMLGVAPLIAFYLLWAPKFLVATYGSSGQEMASRLWIPPLCFDSGSLLFGWLAATALRRGARRAPYRTLAIPALVLSLCVAVTPHAPNSWLAIAWGGLALIGAGGLYAILTADLLTRVPLATTGAAAGFMAAAQSIAHVIANPSIGWLVQHSGGYVWACLALAIWIAPLTAAWWIWQPAEIITGGEP